MSVWKRVNHLTEDEVSHFFRSSLERCHSVRGSLEWQPLMLSVPMVVLLTADLLLCLIISLLITACWTGAYLLSNWLLDVLLLPDSPFMSMLSCLFTGVCGTSVLALMAPKLLLSWEATDHGRMSQPESPRIWSRLRFVVCSRSYTLLCFLLTVVLCKGWWQACVHIAPAFPASALVLLMGLLTSLTLGRLDCGIGAPFVINIDNVATYSHLANVAQVNDNHQLVFVPKWLVILSNCLLEAVVHILTISVWYGIWSLENSLSDWIGLDVFSSSLLSLGIGLSTAMVVHCSQFVLLYLLATSCQSEMRVRKWAAAVLSVLAIFSSISNLRAIWNLLLWLLPNTHQILSVFLIFGVSFLTLSLLGCVSTLHGKVGRSREGLLLPAFYLTYFLFGRKVILLRKHSTLAEADPGGPEFNELSAQPPEDSSTS